MFNLPTFQQFNTYINKLQTEYDFIEKCYDVELEGFIEHFTSFETAVDLLQFIFNDDCNILAIWIYEDNFGRDKHHSFMNNKSFIITSKDIYDALIYNTTVPFEERIGADYV